MSTPETDDILEEIAALSTIMASILERLDRIAAMLELRRES